MFVPNLEIPSNEPHRIYIVLAILNVRDEIKSQVTSFPFSLVLSIITARKKVDNMWTFSRKFPVRPVASIVYDLSRFIRTLREVVMCEERMRPTPLEWIIVDCYRGLAV